MKIPREICFVKAYMILGTSASILTFVRFDPLQCPRRYWKGGSALERDMTEVTKAHSNLESLPFHIWGSQEERFREIPSLHMPTRTHTHTHYIYTVYGFQSCLPAHPVPSFHHEHKRTLSAILWPVVAKWRPNTRLTLEQSLPLDVITTEHASG